MGESDGEADFSKDSFVGRVEEVVSEMNGFRLLPDWMTENRMPIIPDKTDSKTSSYRHIRGPDNSFYALVPRQGRVILRHDHVGLSGQGRDAVRTALNNYSFLVVSLASAEVPFIHDKEIEEEIYDTVTTLGSLIGKGKIKIS